MEQLTECPVCGHNNFSHFLKCKDFTVSHENFNIVKCDKCEFLFTNPRPLPAELGKYYESEEYISHSNTDKGLVNQVYKIVRNFTLSRKFALVKKAARPKNILDIGCGTGMFLNKCSEKGLQTLGIEPNDKARQFGIDNFGLNIKEESHIAEIADHSYDAISMWHVLEHVPNLNDRVKELKRILKKDGTLFIAVPNPLSYDAKVYAEFWAAFDVPRHLYHFSPKNIEMLFEKFGMKVEKKLPMKFDSFYVSMLSEKYINGKVDYFKAFHTGKKSNNYAAKSDVNYSSVIYVIKNA